MKYLKMLRLAAVTTVALTAFVAASSASATTLTGTGCAGIPSGHCAVGTLIHFESEGHVLQDMTSGQGACNFTFEGKTTTTGGVSGTTQPVEGIVERWGYFPCTTATFHTLKAGTFKITSSGGGKGTVTSTGAEWTVVTFGLHCVFSTSNTTIGTVTGGTPAKLAISATIPRTGGTSGAFCGASAPMTGSLKATKPSTLLID